jgi:hypothetical protein
VDAGHLDSREVNAREAGYRARLVGHPPLMDCRCTETTELYGAEAVEYAATHLQAVGDDFQCPDTGRRWELDPGDPDQPRLVQK